MPKTLTWTLLHERIMGSVSVAEKSSTDGALKGLNNSTSTHEHGTRKNSKSQSRVQGTTQNSDTRSVQSSELVMDIVGQLVPILVNAIGAAIATSTKEVIKGLTQVVGVNQVNKLKKEVQSNQFEIDRLEQYSRKENIKIYGIAEQERENTNDIVINLAKELGVGIDAHDISVSHRLPGPKGKPRPIIVKFTRRDVKNEIMKKKKVLKGKSTFKDVFINDDLTKLRGKLMKAIKGDEKVIRTWSVDGRIFCVVKEGDREVKKLIDSPDDLHKLDWSEERVRDLGLYLEL